MTDFAIKRIEPISSISSNVIPPSVSINVSIAQQCWTVIMSFLTQLNEERLDFEIYARSSPTKKLITGLFIFLITCLFVWLFTEKIRSLIVPRPTEKKKHS